MDVVELRSWLAARVADWADMSFVNFKKKLMFGLGMASKGREEEWIGSGMGHESHEVRTGARSEFPRRRKGRLCNADEKFDSMGGQMYKWTLSSVWSLPFNAFSDNALHAGGPLPNPSSPPPPSRSVGGLRLGCARLCGTGRVMEDEGQAFSLSNDTESAVASMFKQVG